LAFKVAKLKCLKVLFHYFHYFLIKKTATIVLANLIKSFWNDELLSHVLHDIEKQIIKVLQSDPNVTEEKISLETKLSMDQIWRGVEWLRQKKLADVSESINISLSLGKNGLDALKNGLPERRLANLVIYCPKTFDENRSSLHGFDFNAAIAHAKKNDWINIEKTGTGSKISLKDPDAVVPYDSDLLISI